MKATTKVVCNLQLTCVTVGVVVYCKPVGELKDEWCGMGELALWW
jgi:hypothetical protein